MEFSYSIKEEQGIVIVMVTGNLIERNQAVPLLEEADNYMLKDVNCFVVDMAGLRYMNSTGLNVFIGLLAKSRKAGGDAVICNVPDKIRELLLVTKLNTVFQVVENIAEAKRFFQGKTTKQ